MTVGRPRDATREQAILAATLEVLADVGYGRLTIDAVAARAKASKPTIYRRWSNKQELVRAAMDASSTVAETDVPDTGSLRGDLLARTHAVATALAGREGRLILGLAEGSLDDPRLCASIDRRTAGSLPQVILDRAVDRGELSVGVRPQLFTEVVLSVLIGRLMAGMAVTDPPVLEHIVDDLLLPVLSHSSA